MICPIETLDKEIQITQGTNVSDPCSIRRTALNKSSRMLGVFLNPLGDFGFHVKQLKKRADVFASRIMSPRLSAADVHIFHRTMYVPSMRYGLAAVAIDEEEFGNVQSRIIPAILKKLNMQSTIPTAIRHGPRELGGLDLYDLRTEVGIESLKFFRDAIYSKSETGKLLRLNMQYSQLEAGIGQDLLQFPAIHLSYITPTWILSLRQFLFMHTMSVTVSDSPRFRFRFRVLKMAISCRMNTWHDTLRPNNAISIWSDYIFRSTRWQNLQTVLAQRQSISNIWMVLARRTLY